MRIDHETGKYDYSDPEMAGILRQLDAAVAHKKMLDRAEEMAARLTAACPSDATMRAIVIDRAAAVAVFVRRDGSRYIMPVKSFNIIAAVRLRRA